MSHLWQNAVGSFHHSQARVVLAITGGGLDAIRQLLTVPGGSQTILEAAVPYAPQSLRLFLGHQPDQYCSEATALQMASVAASRARQLLAKRSSPLATAVTPAISLAESVAPKAGVPEREIAIVEQPWGLACTASLVSGRPKHGPHRCHIALQTNSSTRVAELTLQKGARDREAEDALVSQIILGLLCETAQPTLSDSCALYESPRREIRRPADTLPPLTLTLGETIWTTAIQASPLLAELWSGARSLAWSLPDGALSEQLPGEAPRGVISGSFNPLHEGHRRLRQLAESRVGGRVIYELAIHNVSKPPLDYLSIARRRAQVTETALALTSAPMFSQKARLFPGCTFVIGLDTALRLLEDRFNGGYPGATADALETVRRHDCRFLVCGRSDGDKFLTLKDCGVSIEYADLFIGVDEDDFRVDISSTELRRQHLVDGGE